MLEKLKKLIDQGIVIVNLSQCLVGRVELRLFETGANLFDIGVLNGGDMTTEALYTKMKYWLSQLNDGAFTLDDIKNFIQIDTRGELTYSVHTISYNSTGSPYKVGPIFSGARVKGPNLNPLTIQNMVLRLKNIKYSDDKSDNKILHAKIYLNAYDKFIDKEWVGTFRKKINEKGLEAINMEFINDKVRSILSTAYNPQNRDGNSLFSVSICSVENDEITNDELCRHFTFDSLQLTIFTKDDIL